tara:strand:+ start:144 stop:278 length:135 start_codon:yes stop_codon:yes gene_type:complete
MWKLDIDFIAKIFSSLFKRLNENKNNENIEINSFTITNLYKDIF